MADLALSKHGTRFALFSGVGVFNTVTDFVAYGALVAVGASPLAANLFGFLAANAQSYLINGRVTFRDNGRAAPVSFGGFLKFAGAHALSLAFSTAAIFILADTIGALAAKVAAALVTAVWNYASSAIFAFAPKEEESRNR